MDLKEYSPGLLDAPRVSILALSARHSDKPAGTKEEVLAAFGVIDGAELGVRLLKDAFAAQNATDVWLAFDVCAAFGLDASAEDVLISLIYASWHTAHEEAVSWLTDLKSPTAVPALRHAATWVPDYRKDDDAYSMARNAIHGLGKIPTPEAEQALKEFMHHPNPQLAQTATRVLARRKAASE